MKRLFAFLTIAMVSLAAPAYAISLDAAKAKGLVGERLDGYIGAVASSPSAEVNDLLSTVNTARKAEYEKIAKQNGVTVQAVEKLAAEKLISRAKSGEFYMTTGGGWKQR